MAASWEFTEGDEIAPGRLAVKRLGGGHVFEAYLAWDDTLFAPVVIKVVRPDQVDDERVLASLKRECDMLGRLNHPVILRGFHAVLGGPRPHLVLENLDGPRLSTLVRKYGRLPMAQLLPLGLELCSAVHYLGTQGIVHLDIKPSNTIMGAPPRMIDMSIARTVEDCQRVDHPVGTDWYMAPEQCDPPRTGIPGPPADMWGLGATLFHAVAGYLPFDAGVRDRDKPQDKPPSAPEVRWPQLVQEIKPLPKDVPDTLVKSLHACLDKNPANRPAAAELAHQLEPLVAALPKPILAGWKPKLS